MNNDPDVTVYSFDVFDTTLARIVADPKDIFLLMQAQLPRSDIGLSNKLIKNFYAARLGAEFEARVLKKGGEIKLEEIYVRIKKRHALDEKRIARLMRLEEQIEQRSVYPLRRTTLKIDGLRRQGARIIFTTDMYLPEETIRKMLMDADVCKEGDGLYVSNTVGLTKGSGDLFKYILEEERCKPRQMSHCGDDLHSDIYIPAKLGIRIYQMTDRDLKKILRYHILYLIKGYGKNIMRAVICDMRDRMLL